MKTKEIENPTNLQVWYERNKERFVNWLDGRSEIYSRIAETPTTRRTVLRVNLITVALAFGAVAVTQRPLLTVVSMLCAGYLVRRLGGADDEG